LARGVFITNTPVGISKPLVSDETYVYVPVTTNFNTPNSWARFPLRSYNTASTFWVPPVAVGGSAFEAYVYAGA
jgi:hypothetical protein